MLNLKPNFVTIPYVTSYYLENQKWASCKASDRTQSFFFAGSMGRTGAGSHRYDVMRVMELGSHESLIIDAHFGYWQGEKNTTSMAFTYAERLRRSRFCLVPAGDTATSRRLYDAIAAGCLPVYMGSYDELPVVTGYHADPLSCIAAVDPSSGQSDLPFRSVLNWSSIVMFTGRLSCLEKNRLSGARALSDKLSALLKDTSDAEFEAGCRRRQAEFRRALSYFSMGEGRSGAPEGRGVASSLLLELYGSRIPKQIDKSLPHVCPTPPSPPGPPAPPTLPPSPAPCPPPPAPTEPQPQPPPSIPPALPPPSSPPRVPPPPPQQPPSMPPPPPLSPSLPPPPPPFSPPPPPPLPECAVCGLNAKGGVSCCAIGGAWEGACDSEGELTWDMGTAACKPPPASPPPAPPSPPSPPPTIPPPSPSSPPPGPHLPPVSSFTSLLASLSKATETVQVQQRSLIAASLVFFVAAFSSFVGAACLSRARRRRRGRPAGHQLIHYVDPSTRPGGTRALTRTMRPHKSFQIYSLPQSGDSDGSEDVDAAKGALT